VNPAAVEEVERFDTIVGDVEYVADAALLEDLSGETNVTGIVLDEQKSLDLLG